MRVRSIATRLRTTMGLVLVLIMLCLLVGCAGQQEDGGEGPEQSTQEEPITGSFVGDDIFVISNNSKVGAFLALVAQDPQDAENQPEVRAYLCDGRTINEWFSEGSVEGIDLDLTSDGGAELLGSLKRDVDSAWLSGQIFLDGGTVLGCSVPPASATGIGGLYDLSISGGELSGTSDGGAQLEARLLDDRQQEDGLYPFSGTITPADRQSPQDFQAFATPDASGALRFIFLEDGRVKGGFKKGEGAGYVSQDVGI